jgi:antitoxin PrlF
VVGVPVAVDGGADRSREPLGLGSELRARLRREGGVEDERLPAEVDDAGVPDPAPVGDRDRGPGAVRDFLEREVTRLRQVRVTKEREYRADARRVSLHQYPSKEIGMDVAARLSSKGQLTIPKSVRQALKLEEGDQVIFRVEGQRAVLARTPDLLELAGAVQVPAETRGLPWDEVRRRAWAAQARP